jgi:hydroxymethylbilane synthase
VKSGLVVGTRGSRLAGVQTDRVVQFLKKLNPELAVEIRRITTQGDRDRRTPLEALGPNIFVKELEEALLDGRIDLAVHSLKDVPTEFPAGLGIAAVPERLDPRDVLVASARLADLPAGAKIGTSSLRRSIQIARLRPDIQIAALRGNVETRVRKTGSGVLDGVVLAAAGLSRLGLADRICQYLEPEDFLPAVGQGALALEVRLTDKDVTELVAPLNDRAAWACVTAERAFLLELGGGCRAPIAALGTVNGDILKLKGMIGSLKYQRMLRDSEEGDSLSAEEIGISLARKLLEMGAVEYISEVRDS